MLSVQFVLGAFAAPAAPAAGLGAGALITILAWLVCFTLAYVWRRSFGAMLQWLADELDIVLFNDERQWHLLDQFTQARRRIFYALHYARLYGKAGSWESIRAAVDLQLANSNWTADQICAEIGHRPTVQLGGVNTTNYQLIVVAVALALMAGLQWIVYRTRFGKAMRAVSHNFEMASLFNMSRWGGDRLRDFSRSIN